MALLVADLDAPAAPRLVSLAGADNFTDDALSENGVFNMAFQMRDGTLVGVIPLPGQNLVSCLCFWF